MCQDMKVKLKLQLTCRTFKILTVFSLFFQTNQCTSNKYEDILLTEIDIIPFLNDICNKNHNDSRRFDLKNALNLTEVFDESLDPSSGKSSISDFQTSSDTSHHINQTLLTTTNVLLDELLLCVNHFSTPNIGPRRIDTNNSPKKEDAFKDSMMAFDNEPSTVNTSYDLAHTINFDSELMSMLDEFDVLSKAMKIETESKGDDYEMLHNSSLLSENTFLNSAIILYNTFMNNHNISNSSRTVVSENFDTSSGSKGTRNKINSDKGFFDNQKRILSSINR